MCTHKKKATKIRNKDIQEKIIRLNNNLNNNNNIKQSNTRQNIQKYL